MSKATVAMLKSWAGSFVAAAITALLSVIVTTGDLPSDLNGVKAIIIAGLVAVLPVIRNYFDKSYTGYGMGDTAE